jgi:rod shape-determining protein MreC
MESFYTRYRNQIILGAILFTQIIMLASQVRIIRPAEGAIQSKFQTSADPQSVRLIRVWATSLVTPFERLFISTGRGVRSIWHNYVDLRGVREHNQQLEAELQRVRAENMSMHLDADQGRRLQSLLGFKERFISRTVAAQVIGTSGSDQARIIYIDRGRSDGIKEGMAVITPDGIVGKIARADRGTSQVLLISDVNSGAGVILERLGLKAVLEGSQSGYPIVTNVMSDEKVEPGDRVITSGGDLVYPKGLVVGTVTAIKPDPDRDPFLQIRIKPAANLSRLEEVLVVTQMQERAPLSADDSLRPTAADILAERLPKVPKGTTVPDCGDQPCPISVILAAQKAAEKAAAAENTRQQTAHKPATPTPAAVPNPQNPGPQ